MSNLSSHFDSASAAVSASAPAPAAPAAAFVFDPETDIIAAPRDPALWLAYREQLARWREAKRRELAYDDTLYGLPEFAWGASSYACYFLMMYDELFFDTKTGRYTVDAVLEEGRREFGGYDSVVLWHSYPRIGVDPSNQFDFYRDMPGGLAGVREVVRAFHAGGLRVYINYNPWDRDTRREEKPDADMLAEFVRELEVDGIFLDTMARGDELREGLDATRPGVILEGENTPSLERLADHHASWAQWFDDSEVPGVLRNKWFERRHMQHQKQRWNSDHSAELHTAWMNGSGMVIWETSWARGCRITSGTARGCARCCRCNGATPRCFPAKAGRRSCRWRRRRCTPRAGPRAKPKGGRAARRGSGPW